MQYQEDRGSDGAGAIDAVSLPLRSRGRAGVAAVTSLRGPPPGRCDRACRVENGVVRGTCEERLGLATADPARTARRLRGFRGNAAARERSVSTAKAHTKLGYADERSEARPTPARPPPLARFAGGDGFQG